MKKQLSTLILLFTFLGVNAQVTFEKGYYINKKGEKFEGYIKNQEWLKTPNSILFKNNINNEEIEIDAKDIKEFEIYQELNYKSFYIKKYNYILKESDNRNPTFENEEILLNKIVGGKLNLYSYSGNKMKKTFFLEKKNGDFLQLVNFRVTLPNNQILLYSTYKQDLESFLNCTSVKDELLKEIKYSSRSLKNLVEKHNDCNGSISKSYNLNDKKAKFFIIPKLGLSFNNLNLKNTSIDFNENINGLGFYFGAELEISLPFNKRKWSFLIEPSYTIYEIEKTGAKYNSEGITSRDKRLQFGVGLRHYFLIKNKEVYATGRLFVPVSLDKSVEYSQFENVNEFTSFSIISIGIGTRIKNKIYTELNFGLPIIDTPVRNRTDINYSTFSVFLTIGYKIF